MITTKAQYVSTALIGSAIVVTTGILLRSSIDYTKLLVKSFKPIWGKK